jgi:hypothetical protein
MNQPTQELHVGIVMVPHGVSCALQSASGTALGCRTGRPPRLAVSSRPVAVGSPVGLSPGRSVRECALIAAWTRARFAMCLTSRCAGTLRSWLRASTSSATIVSFG